MKSFRLFAFVFVAALGAALAFAVFSHTVHAAEGLSNDQIAERLDTRREVVSLWRKRFFEERLAGLEERARPGRPRSFPPRTGRAG